MTVFIDSNIAMYTVGAPHPNKEAAQRRLDELITRSERLITDTEVLQELLHRYVAIQRLEAIQPAFDAIHGIADEIVSVEPVDIETAKRIVLGRYGLSARDAVHIAVMESRGVDRILSFDRGFDRYPGIERLS